MMLVVSFVTAFLGYVVFVSWYVWDKYDKKVELSRTVAGVLSQNFAKIIFLDDVREVDDTIAVLKSYSDIARVVLYKKDGKAVFIHTSLHNSHLNFNTHNFNQFIPHFKNIFNTILP